MCERCGFSGCEHNWKIWNPKEFWKGYKDYKDNPNIEGIENNAGYNAGIFYAKENYDKFRKSLR